MFVNRFFAPKSTKFNHGRPKKRNHIGFVDNFQLILYDINFIKKMEVLFSSFKTGSLACRSRLQNTSKCFHRPV